MRRSVPSSITRWPAARCWPDGHRQDRNLVECVVDRIEHRGVAPDSILVLTFSRKAAADLRARIAARLGEPHHGGYDLPRVLLRVGASIRQ